MGPRMSDTRPPESTWYQWYPTTSEQNDRDLWKHYLPQLRWRVVIKFNYNEYHLKQIYELNEIIRCKRDIVHVKTLVNSLNE